MHKLSIFPHSDDVVEVEIRDDGGKLLYANEYPPGKKFRINYHFMVSLEFTGSGGWTLVISDVNEDKFGDSDGFHRIYNVRASVNAGAYGMGLEIESKIPFSIEGVYGDPKSKVLEIIEDVIDDRNEAERLLKRLAEENFLKL